jgi:hypothetical protein
MASGDLTAASYVTKERRAEANNTKKGNITPFNHDMKLILCFTRK